MAYAGMRSVTVGAFRLDLLPIMLPILLLLRLPIRLLIKLLIRLFTIDILSVRIIVAWLGCLLYNEIFDCHLKGPVGGIY
jgi:uncharacterized membrane protein